MLEWIDKLLNNNFGSYAMKVRVDSEIARNCVNEELVYMIYEFAKQNIEIVQVDNNKLYN